MGRHAAIVGGGVIGCSIALELRRRGVRHGSFDVAFNVNNITDERTLLALGRERGTRARSAT